MADEMVTGSLRQELTVEIRGELGAVTLKMTLALELINPLVPIDEIRLPD